MKLRIRGSIMTTDFESLAPEKPGKESKIDIKNITDELEKGNGCRLLFDEAFQQLNRDFDGQMKIVKQVEEESKSRNSNILTFKDLDHVAEDQNKRKLDVKGVSVEHTGKDQKTPTPIFQELLITDHNTKKVLGVEKACKPRL